ncbi:MAG: thioredoxin fold domain-containing protein [Bacteroidetes bacterium]|nr:thioredoxin fold domain-containing protein [Bacteroidota bacterium]
MKKIAFGTLWLLLAFGLELHAQTDSILEFSKLSFEAFVKKARAEHKPIMLYFHFNGCGGCVQLEKTTFKDSSCINFMHKNFLTYSINTKEPEGKKINEFYKVRIHPTLLFLNPDTQQVHKLVGYYDPQDFLQHAKRALSQESNLSAMDDAYYSGNRNPDFLLNYCYLLRDAYQLDSNRINAYLQTQSVEDLNSETNRKFIYEFCVHKFNINVSYGSKVFNNFLANRKLYYALFDSEQVDTRLAWIISAHSYSVFQSGTIAEMQELITTWKLFENSKDREFIEMDGRTTGFMFSAHLGLKWQLILAVKQKDSKAIQQAKIALKNALWDDHEKLNQYAWAQVEQKSEIEILEFALECSNRSLELHPCYAYTDTKAWLLYLIGNKDSSLKVAKEALQLAEVKKEDSSSTRYLIKLLEQK